MKYSEFARRLAAIVESQPDDNDRQYSVFQEFENGTGEQTRRFVSHKEAMLAVVHYTTNVAAKAGITKRVIVTDGDDCCVFEWTSAAGLVWPKLPESVPA